MKLLIVLIAGLSCGLATPLAESNKRLIQTSEESPAVWMTAEEVDTLSLSHVGFMDITDHQEAYAQNVLAPPSTLAIPSGLRFQSTVRAALPNLSKSRAEEFLTQFSNFNNRYYTQQSGVDSSNWLYSLLQAIISSSNYRGTASVRQFTHTWAQKSVIARIEGTLGGNSVVVLGAHQDSTAPGASTGSRAPGADDDGTGSTTILEAFRSLLQANFVPKYSIEFQWYAAEEVGLLGSQAIAQQYKNDGIDVIAMSQFDMTGYLSANKKIGFVTDFTDAELNTFLRKVVDEYCEYGWVNKQCGYACSDHASYYRAGFKAAFPFEDNSNSAIHTTRDTLALVSFDHVIEFAKLAVGFAIEVAEPST